MKRMGSTVTLAHGGHSTPEQGMCAAELVSYVVREPFSDHPKCTSPVVSAFLRSLNDRLDDEKRQLLLPFLVECDDDGRPVLDEDGWMRPGPVVGTNTGEADDVTRGWMCVDWLIHEYAPAMFRFAGWTAEAEQFEQMVAIVDWPSWDSVRTTVYEVRERAWATRASAVKRLAGELQRRADAVADADADADAVADAVAVAVADADADAVAVADAVADAGAVAGADADAGAVAVADAVADAGAVADAWKQAIEAAVAAKKSGGDYWSQRDAAYGVLYPVMKERLEPVSAGLLESSLQLLGRLIMVGRDPEA
jgi:hypothetical protein